MALSFVGASSNVGTDSSVASSTIPTVEDGDLGYALVQASNSSTTTLTPSAGWTIAYGPYPNSANVNQTWVLTKTLTAADSGGAVGGTLSAYSVHASAMFAVRGGTLDVQVDREDDSLVTTFNIAPFTPTTDNDLVVTIAGISYQYNRVPPTGTITPPSGWTTRTEISTASGTVRTGAAVLTKQLTGQSGVAQSLGSGTLNVNHRDNIVTFAFSPLPPGVNTSNFFAFI